MSDTGSTPGAARGWIRGSWTGGFVLLAVAALGGFNGCAVSGSYVRPGPNAAPVAPPDVASVDVRLLLIGDAGYPRLDGPEPVFAPLAADAAELPDRTWIVFLGDNIYPHGLPPETAGDRALAERRLREQVDGALASGAHVIFIPGNHDYALDGWPGIVRERAYIETLHDPRLQALPEGGCPGPEIVDAGKRLRMLLLDTQWWFQAGSKPGFPPSDCPFESETAIVNGLRDAIASAGDRRVVVLGHHPLVSHGSHGGHFTWRQHVFPLVDASRWAWVPLPVIGSLYPIARMSGVASQDFSNGTYENFNESIRSALRPHPVLLYAAGHEHNLQLLDLPGTEVHVVSGAGTVVRPAAVGREHDTRFASGHAGYVRLDILRDGRAWLQVVVVSKDGVTERPFASWIGD